MKRTKKPRFTAEELEEQGAGMLKDLILVATLIVFGLRSADVVQSVGQDCLLANFMLTT